MYVKAIRGSWLDDGRLVDNIVMEGLYLPNLPRECMNVWSDGITWVRLISM